MNPGSLQAVLQTNKLTHNSHDLYFSRLRCNVLEQLQGPKQVQQESPTTLCIWLPFASATFVCIFHRRLDIYIVQTSVQVSNSAKASWARFNRSIASARVSPSQARPKKKVGTCKRVWYICCTEVNQALWVILFV